MSDPVEATTDEALRCPGRVVGEGQEPAAVMFAVGDAPVRPGRVVARIVDRLTRPLGTPLLTACG